jgi:hypothetical protein
LVIAGIVLVIAAFALIQRSRSSNVQNAVPIPASGGSNGQAAPPLPKAQSNQPANQVTSTGQEARAASSPSRNTRVRRASSSSRIRKSQSRSKRSQARRVRRARR